MTEVVRGSAKRILVIGAAGEHSEISPVEALAAEGMLIVMEIDPGRAAQARNDFERAGLSDRASVIVGDPSRMLHKLSGPFDVIFYNGSQLGSMRDKLTALLRQDGILITNDKKCHGV